MATVGTAGTDLTGTCEAARAAAMSQRGEPLLGGGGDAREVRDEVGVGAGKRCGALRGGAGGTARPAGSSRHRRPTLRAALFHGREGFRR